MLVVVVFMALAAQAVPPDWSCDRERWADGICDCSCTASDDADCTADNACPAVADDDEDDGDGDGGCTGAGMPAFAMLAGLFRRRQHRR